MPRAGRPRAPRQASPPTGPVLSLLPSPLGPLAFTASPVLGGGGGAHSLGLVAEGDERGAWGRVQDLLGARVEDVNACGGGVHTQRPSPLRGHGGRSAQTLSAQQTSGGPERAVGLDPSPAGPTPFRRAELTGGAPLVSACCGRLPWLGSKCRQRWEER